MTGAIITAVAGLGGAIGTTVATGVGCHSRPDLVSPGRVIYSPGIAALPIELPALGRVVLTGWDPKQQPLYDLAVEQAICTDATLRLAQPLLETLVPRKPYEKTSGRLGSWIQSEAAFLRDLAKRHNSEAIILVNLCPTEGQSKQCLDTKVPWKNLDKLELSQSGITPSRIYFRVAIEAGAHFVNFTPNVAETAALQRLAVENGICFSGRDGKTGQTFLKTVLAPAFRDRNLRIDGWFSTNLLGNADGKVLASPDAGQTKRASKRACLAEILGYSPGGDLADSCHQVHIHYYPPRGDAKEAWDNIDFSGFLGGRMQVKLNLLARDSILAAPAVLDLVTLTAVAARHERCGYLEELGYFFKSALTEKAEHSSSEQYTTLVSFLKRLGSRSRSKEPRVPRSGAAGSRGGLQRPND